MDFAPKCKIVYSLLSIIFLTGCAEMAPPPGGEVDKTKPRIVSSLPANGSTHVEPGNSITIKFSERIVKPLTKRPVYISPRPKSDIKLDWKSNKLIITLLDSFKVDQTYIISFAEGVVDLRRNPLDSGAVIAFTTGDVLSGGVISGTVVDDNNSPQNNIVVGLYNNLYQNDIVIDSIYPTYLVVTNNEGYFSFQYIPIGEYQLIAFRDKNKNEKLNINTELYGLPDRKIVLDSSHTTLQNLLLGLTPEIENDPKIIAVRQNYDNVFQIDFNVNIANQNGFDFLKPKISLYRYIDSSQVYPQKFILKQEILSDNSIFAYFGILPDGLYRLNFKQNDSLYMFDSIKVKELSDKNKPTISLFNPTPLKIMEDSLDVFIQFSEPLDKTKVTKETFYVIGVDSNLIFPNYSFVNSSLCKISNDFLQKDVFQYLLHISEFDLFDFNGNKLGDSTATYEINLIDKDSLGTVKGAISHLSQSQSEYSTVLFFKNISTNKLFTYISDDNLFNLKLLQGNYVLSGFIDLNDNKKRDYGTIAPLQYAEPFVTYNDTIKVRARFETTGLQLEFK